MQGIKGNGYQRKDIDYDQHDPYFRTADEMIPQCLHYLSFFVSKMNGHIGLYTARNSYYLLVVTVYRRYKRTINFNDPGPGLNKKTGINLINTGKYSSNIIHQGMLVPSAGMLNRRAMSA